jgi:transposase-like protein
MVFDLNQIPSHAQIRKHLRQIRFGKHVRCPRCGARAVYPSETRYRCVRCRRPFSLLTGTFLEGSRLSYRTLWALLWCWTQQVPVRQTIALCGVSDTTVRHTFTLFRSQVPEEFTLLEGKVQLDEAFFGGKKGLGLMLGKQVGTRKLAHAIVPVDVQRGHAFQFLAQNIRPKTRLQTDGGGIYRGIHRWWPVTHRTDVHAKWEFALTSEIEGAFGNLRTFLRRMYHHVSTAHFPEYAEEFCARFSHPEIFASPLSFLKISLSSVPTS